MKAVERTAEFHTMEPQTRNTKGDTYERSTPIYLVVGAL